MADKIHDAEITRGAVQLLTTALSQPGWTKKAGELYAAGELLEELDAEFGEDKAPESVGGSKVSADDFDKWAKRVVTVSLTEKQREACKAAVTDLVTSGRVVPTMHFMKLGKSLGIE